MKSRAIHACDQIVSEKQRVSVTVESVNMWNQAGTEQAYEVQKDAKQNDQRKETIQYRSPIWKCVPYLLWFKCLMPKLGETKEENNARGSSISDTNFLAIWSVYQPAHFKFKWKLLVRSANGMLPYVLARYWLTMKNHDGKGHLDGRRYRNSWAARI